VGAVGEAVGLVLDDRDYEGGSGVRFNVNITYLAADRGDLVYRKNFDLCLGKGRMKTHNDREVISNK
jgi:hypothetical protein